MLKIFCEEPAIVPDLTQPFAYVALGIQLERTSNPNGGEFYNRDEMVGLIASALA